MFDEPDFPEVPLQVPGGTVDPGEALLEAARREFEEETGLQVESAFRFLGSVDHDFLKEGERLTLHRNYFHLFLEGDQPDTWLHYEEKPSGGGEPILFRFFWIDLASAPSCLGLGLHELLDQLPHPTARA